MNEYAVNSMSGETSKVWLVTWNKDNWNWDGFAERCDSTKAGQTFIESWACASKSPRIGDEVFMLKLGDMPRGIIGHGVVSREPYEKEHYDASKAAAGKTEKAIDIRFDRLIDYNHDPYIPQDELISKCAAQHWSPQNSGIEIKPEVLPALRRLWNAVTSAQTVFFTRLKDDPTLETLAGIFEKNVIPLLQEYFYEDYEKIQLVLGDNAKDDEYKFVLDKPLKVRDIFKGNPDVDLPEKSYSIQHEAFRRIESYKQIAEGL